ncbi:MAG: helix-turn-helix domain-containing protein [Patescibacteria group bacterium]|jgi:sugar-specific transcriptional regulator TrmB
MHKDNKEIEFLLQESGFSDKESAAYLALLEIGKGSVLDVSRQSKVDRTTLYRILEKFLAIPLVQTFKENKKTTWAALHPRFLVEYAQAKKTAVQEIYPALEQLYDLSADKPKLTYFEGVEGLRNSIESLIKEVKHRGEILSFSAPGAAAVYYSKKRFEGLARMRIKKQILSRLLMSSIEGAPGYKLGEDWKNWRHVKLVDAKQFPFKASIDIWNNKIAIMTTKDRPIGVVIEDKTIADTMRSIFELCWQKIPDQE